MRAVRLIDSVPTVVELPEPLGEGVVVDVVTVGVCGSDLHLMDSGWNPPATLGHEICGRTPDGRLVSVEPLLPCGACEACARGDDHLCETGGLTMIGIGTDGGMADRVLVPERCLVPLPAGIAAADGSLVEPVSVAVHGLRLAGFDPSRRVAVVGAGSIGLCTLAAVIGSGGRADVVARHDHQRNAVDRLGGGTDPSGTYDIVIETAGTQSALARAVELARPGGTIVMLSIHWEPTLTPGLAMWMKELTMVCSMTYGSDGTTRDIDRAAAIVATLPDLGATVITHRFGLDDAPVAFATARDRAAGAIKVVLEPR